MTYLHHPLCPILPPIPLPLARPDPTWSNDVPAPVPVVWSEDGPVPPEGVRPRRRVQSNTSCTPFCQLHWLVSKVQLLAVNANTHTHTQRRRRQRQRQQIYTANPQNIHQSPRFSPPAQLKSALLPWKKKMAEFFYTHACMHRHTCAHMYARTRMRSHAQTPHDLLQPSSSEPDGQSWMKSHTRGAGMQALVVAH